MLQTQKVRLCDQCGSDIEVEQYTIVFPGEHGRRSVDLCGEHAAPLEDIEKLFEGKPPRARLPKGQPVVTPGEIERQRRQARKKTARKK